MVGKVEADPPTPDPDAIKMFVGQVPRSMEEVNIVNIVINRLFPEIKINKSLLNEVEANVIKMGQAKACKEDRSSIEGRLK